MTPASSSLDAQLETRRVLVCVGTGGVGKTTVAAALAVETARRGRRVLVLTIDPARRLADAIGLPELGGEAQPLPPAVKQRLGLPERASLDVAMLDMKSTFDGLVERFAEGPEARRRILENPIYQHVSDALAGSGEYAAMEKVYEVSESGSYDIVILDTPPSQHALDFLEAPRRLLDFLDSRVVALLLHPAMAAGRFGFRLFRSTSQRVLRILERVSGVAFLEDISEFLLAFEGMSEGFRQRATLVRELLLGPDAAFVLVAGASRESARNALEFLAQVHESGARVESVVVNRVRCWPDEEPVPAALGDLAPATEDVEALAQALAGGTPDSEARAAARSAVEVAKGYASLVRQDERNMRALREWAERSGRVFARVPEQPEDVADARGLLRIADAICGRPSAAPATNDRNTVRAMP